MNNSNITFLFSVLLGLCLVAMTSSVQAIDVGELSADRILVVHETGDLAGKVTGIKKDSVLTIVKDECLLIYANNAKGAMRPLTLEVVQGDFRLQMKKRVSAHWEICGKHVSFTEPETKVRYTFPETDGQVSSAVLNQGEFNIVVEPEKVDFDRARAVEGTKTLYWGILMRFPGDPNQSGNEAFAYTRDIENGGMKAFVRTAEIIAKSGEFRNNVLKKYSAEDVIDGLYWRFLGSDKPVRDNYFSHMVDLVKKGKTHFIVVDLITCKDFMDRVRANNYFRSE